MKKIFALIIAVAFVVGSSATMVFAGNGIDVNGKHYNVNIIGKKGKVNVKDGTNGSSIFIPLRNVNSRDGMICPEDGSYLVDDVAPTTKDALPVGTKIYFLAGDSFDILDRDGTDNDGATIQVPVDPDTKEILFDIYVRVLGKPNGCMNIDGYAYDGGQGLWFWSGSVYLNRTKGKQAFIKANDLFDVWWCDYDGETSCQTTPEEISVFSDVFDEYFWNIQNDGAKLVQVRIYPRPID